MEGSNTGIATYAMNQLNQMKADLSGEADCTIDLSSKIIFSIQCVGSFWVVIYEKQ